MYNSKDTFTNLIRNKSSKLRVKILFSDHSIARHIHNIARDVEHQLVYTSREIRIYV